MADFTSDRQQSFKSALPYLEIDPNMEFMNQFTQLNPTSTDTSSSIFQSLMGFSIDSFLTPQVPEFPGALAESFPAGIFRDDDDDLKNVIVMDSMPAGNDFHKCKKRLAIHELDDSCGNSSSHFSDDGNKRKNSSGKGKRLKSTENEEEKPKGVVHVRARRGQATDSHSLAERVRRGKINERLKCLQDIVPGCEKTMGMAGMLDEIINYVRSLQNQVDFLSMKLTAASTFHDFNLDTDPMETLQRAKAYEAQKMSQAYEAQRIVRSGYDQGLASTQLGPLDFSFGPYPSLQLP